MTPQDPINLVDALKKQLLNLPQKDYDNFVNQLTKLFDAVEQKRKQQTQKTSDEILKMELDNLKALTDRKIANEKALLDLNLANAKKLPDRSKLKIDEAKKELIFLS